MIATNANIDSKTDFVVIIPCRYGSTRLKAKPLREIAGKPMFLHVYNAALSSGAARVYIATDDERIARACTEHGVEHVMTDVDHQSGTDRIYQAARLLNLHDQQIVVNVQGDEPLMPPQNINQVASLLANHAQAQVATLCSQIKQLEQISNPNVVKVVRDNKQLALYFSRAAIPLDRDFALNIEASTLDCSNYYKHIGIYAYKVGFLKQFVNWESAKLEQIERLEQLRVMANGGSIIVGDAMSEPGPGIDTEQDLELVNRLMRSRKETN